MSIEITTQDEKALRAYVKRKPRKVHELRAFLRGRLDRRNKDDHPDGGSIADTNDYWDERLVRYRLRRRRIEDAANRGVDRLLRKWKSAGLVDNKVRGTWTWAGKP